MPKGSIDSVLRESVSDQLRSKLARLEAGMADARRCDPAALLRLRSEIEDDLEALAERAVDVRAERTRAETVDHVLESKADVLVARARRAGGMRAMRQAAAPPETHWWWHLDTLVVGQRRALVWRLAAGLAVIALVVLAGSRLVAQYGGTPEQRQAARHVLAGEQLVMRGDLAGAIAEYRLAVAYDAPQPQLWADLSVLEELAGDAGLAQEARAHARALTQNTVSLDILLARSYERSGAYDRSLAHAQSAVSAAPDSAEAFLARGSALEALDAHDMAIADFSRASDLAMEQGQDALYVLARTRMGMLMQQSGAESGPGSSGF